MYYLNLSRLLHPDSLDGLIIRALATIIKIILQYQLPHHNEKSFKIFIILFSSLPSVVEDSGPPSYWVPDPVQIHVGPSA